MADTDTLDVPDQSSFGTDFLPGAGGSMPQVPDASSPAAPPAGPPNLMRDVGFDPAQRDAATQGLIGARQDKMRSESFVDRQAESRMEEDRGRMDRAYRAEGAAKDAMPPAWNADKERAERVRGPMEQFGSIGSIFAMMASGFTRTPMTSALNAGAAAMTSIQQHDEKGYESAYAAWKANTDLAVKRFGMEREMFQDANTLMSSDMNAWRQKRLSIAARFEDTKALTMLQNGMDPELLELDAKKIDSARKLTEAQKGFEEFDIQRRIFADGVKAFEEANPNATPQQSVQNRLQLLHEIKSGARSWQQEALRNFQLTNPTATPEQTQAFMQSLRGTGASNANTNLTGPRQRAGDVKTYREELQKEKNEDGSAKYTPSQIADMAAKREKELAQSATPTSSNQRDKIAGQITRFDLADKTVDKVEALLKKHNALTGLGGRITRPAEVASNWFGSNETDRAQFKSYIEELREWGPRLLNESGGRPLSSEAARINTIVRGLDAGDTTANTARGLRELQGLFREMRGQLEERYKGTWTPAGSKAGTGAPAPAGPNWWRNLPDKRTEAGGNAP